MIGVEHQVRLIDDLLDVSRAMSGNLGLAKQSMPLLPVLADAVESLRAMALEKGLRVVTDYALGEHEVHGDPDRVRQIFVNLLSNAVKFTPPGGTIRVSATTKPARGFPPRPRDRKRWRTWSARRARAPRKWSFAISPCPTRMATRRSSASARGNRRARSRAVRRSPSPPSRSARTASAP